MNCALDSPIVRTSFPSLDPSDSNDLFTLIFTPKREETSREEGDKREGRRSTVPSRLWLTE